MCSVIFEKFEEAEALAGVATAGIAWGAMAADQLKLPFLYVRPKPKEHGLGNQIEGECQAGQKILVIEDLVSTGKSSLQACEALRLAGAEVVGMISIFNYGFSEAEEACNQAGIRFISLTNYEVLIQLALQNGTIQENHLDTLLNWRKNPSTWQGVL